MFTVLARERDGAIHDVTEQALTKKYRETTVLEFATYSTEQLFSTGKLTILPS